MPIADEYLSRSRRTPRRRLSDKLFNAFHNACDAGALDLAGRLLSHMVMMINHPSELPTGVERRKLESLNPLRERLSSLQHPSPWRTNAGWAR